MLTDDELGGLIDGLRAGHPASIETFWNHFGPLLHGLAARNLSPGLQRRFGPEDVAQSACRSFLRRTREGQYELTEADHLWRLLCAITLTKIREKTRHHQRRKRAVDRETALTGDIPGAADPADVAEFNDLLETVLDHLDAEERRMLELRLREHGQAEIADRLGCSERTVRRILKRAQAKFEQHLAE